MRPAECVHSTGKLASVFGPTLIGDGLNPRVASPGELFTTPGYNAHALTIKTKVAAMFGVEGVLDTLDAATITSVQTQFSDHAVAIKNTTGATRDAYQQVHEMTARSLPLLSTPMVTISPKRKTNSRLSRLTQSVLAKNTYESDRLPKHQIVRPARWISWMRR